MLDVTRLRVLVSVARQGSVTAAARELNYAQPSISHHLARLEAETGTKLIQRAGRGVRLTDAGRLLADRAAEVLGRLDAAENELAAHAGLRRGRVRLAAFPSALGTIVPVAAARLRAEHPGVEIMLTEAEPPEALRMLRAGYVDAALVFRHEPGPGPDAPRARLLLDEPVFLVTPSPPPGAAEAAQGRETTAAGSRPPGASPPREAAGPPGPTGPREPSRQGESGQPVPSGPRESPLAEAGDAGTGGPDLADYADERWIAGCERCRSHLLDQCARAGFTPKIAFTTDDYVAVQALVAAGLGVTTLPGLALSAARHPGVRAVPLPGARRYVYAVTYGSPPDPPPTARLLDAMTAASASHCPGGVAGPGPGGAAGPGPGGMAGQGPAAEPETTPAIEVRRVAAEPSHVKPAGAAPADTALADTAPGPS